MSYAVGVSRHARPPFDLLEFLAESAPGFAVRDARAAWSARGRSPRHREEKNVPQSSLAPSLLRVGVPLIVGYLLSIPIVQLAGIGTDELASLVTAGLTGAYYTGARAAEHYLSPRFGWLLGYAAAPAYSGPAALAPKGGPVTLPADDQIGD